MNLFDLGQTIEGYASLNIQSASCSKILSPLSSCQKCQDICPVQALDFANGQWSARQCIGCGLCVIACPNHVFRLDEDALLQATSPDKPLVVSCRHNPAPTGSDLTINCFQQLYPELILRLLSQSQKLVLYADEHICSQCANHWYAPGLSLQLAAFGLPLDNFALVSRPEELAEQMHVQQEPSRRSFFRQLFHETLATSQKSIVQTTENLLADLPTELTLGEASPAVLPIRRAPLRSLYAQHPPSPAVAEQELPYRLLSVDYCTFCGACTNMCPTGALTLHTTEDESKHLLFQPLLCTQCQLCQDICMHKKIYWTDRLTIGQLLTPTPLALAQSPAKTCSQCEHTYWQYPADESQNICPFCR